jgi:hypothetical protein
MFKLLATLTSVIIIKFVKLRNKSVLAEVDIYRVIALSTQSARMRGSESSQQFLIYIRGLRRAWLCAT